MNTHGALEVGIKAGQNISQSYLADLTDADLLVRPVPGSNHIAWQLGHLLSGEVWMIEKIAPGTMPKLPEGFDEKHKKEQAASDNPADFYTKAEYLDLLQKVRAGTLAALAKMSDDDLDKQSPPALVKFLPTWGEVFAMQGSHWMMHAGQWAIVRRKLGKPPLF